MDERIQNEPSILSASHIVIKPMCMPERVVLRKVGKEFITHKERLKAAPPKELNSCGFVHGSFDSGSYFPIFAYDGDEEKARAAATKDFEERCRKL